MEPRSDSGTLREAYVLGSGSSSNAYLFKTSEATILVDNGFSYRELTRRLALARSLPRQIDYLLLTHSHGDHCKGVPLLVNRHSPLCCATEQTFSALSLSVPEYCPVEAGGVYQWSGVGVTTFALSHDTPGAVGFSLNFGGFRCVIITDTGVVSPSMAAEAEGADILFLESNYCPDLLASGPYPPAVKQRISGSGGHLSNMDAARFLNLLLERRPPKRVFLCHLSAKNNHPHLVADTMKAMLTGALDVTVCPRDAFVPVSVP
ncbi:MAG: MBL fold metallo-hydrolase [Spirochaetales bacterium]|nr:MBL fold metallo-hydrolase [Spirochaetales bacterium]